MEFRYEKETLAFEKNIRIRYKVSTHIILPCDRCICGDQRLAEVECLSRGSEGVAEELCG